MKNKFLIIPKEIVTVNETNEIIRGGAVEVQDGRIKKIYKANEFNKYTFEGEIIDVTNLTLIPGFVQTHVHLCQTLFRGLADDLELLDWLKEKIFPMENAHSKESLRVSAKLGINEIFHSGTTTIMDMGTIRHEEVIFEELINSGIRAFAGKCMVDRNDLLPNFKESTKDSIVSSIELAEAFHNTEEGRIRYAFAPRFVLSCSEELLKETTEIVKDFEGSMFHTHASENKGEIEEVRRLTGMENIEYFNSIGALGENTLMAHGIHVNDKEVELLKETKTRIAHCPSANLKLGSGIANIPRYLNSGISVSLGADGAPCNNNLNIFTEMRLAALIQKPIHSATVMDALTTFRLATIEGAKALHIDDETGSIAEGKKADLVLLNLQKPNVGLLDEDANIYSNIVYSANRDNVEYVFVEGREVVQKGKSLVYDENEIFVKGKEELKSSLKRIG